MAIINLISTGYDGLIESIVVSVANSFRTNVHRWKNI